MGRSLSVARTDRRHPSTLAALAPTAERADRPADSAPTTPAAPTPLPVRYALAFGTFAVPDDAERVEAKLNHAGFSTVRFRQRASAKLFSVHVGSLKDPNEGQATVERLQKEGYASTVLLSGRSGTAVRVGEAMPLRTAVQVAETCGPRATTREWSPSPRPRAR